VVENVEGRLGPRDRSVAWWAGGTQCFILASSRCRCGSIDRWDSLRPDPL